VRGFYEVGRAPERRKGRIQKRKKGDSRSHLEKKRGGRDFEHVVGDVRSRKIQLTYCSRKFATIGRRGGSGKGGSRRNPPLRRKMNGRGRKLLNAEGGVGKTLKEKSGDRELIGGK